MKNLSDRREFLIRIGGTAVAASTLARAAEPETVVVKTTKGQLRGANLRGADQGYAVFKGVRYAGPSEGANRFKPPTKLEPWTGVRDALGYGRQAIQNRDPNSLPGSSLAPQTENCQFLNIWTPAVNDGKKRAVMFYSHGGASRPDRADGTRTRLTMAARWPRTTMWWSSRIIIDWA